MTLAVGDESTTTGNETTEQDASEAGMIAISDEDLINAFGIIINAASHKFDNDGKLEIKLENPVEIITISILRKANNIIPFPSPQNEKQR